MLLNLLLALLCSGAGAASTGTAVSGPALGDLVRHRLPPGWTVKKAAALARANAVGFSGGPRIGIRLELLPGAPSRSEEVARLMRPPWDSGEKWPVMRIDTMTVAGVETTLWRRYSRLEPYRRGGGADAFSLDEFCTVPLDGHFLLMIYSVTDSVPFRGEDPRRAVWLEWLRSVRLAAHPVRTAP